MAKDYSTTKLLIQDNINQMNSKMINCDATIVENIASASALLAVANEKVAISQEDVRGYSEEIKQNIELFPKRCSCKESYSIKFKKIVRTLQNNLTT